MTLNVAWTKAHGSAVPPQTNSAQVHMSDSRRAPDAESRSDEAARAIAAVERFLAERTEAPPPNAAALLDLRLAIARVCEADLLRRDPLATSILRDLAFAETMEDLHAEIDRLGRRVAVLTGDRPAPPARPARPGRRMLRL